MDNNSGNAQRTIAHGMSKRKLIKSIGQKSINQEKARPTRPKGASSRTSNP